jgi:pimeloyl-ACP methyl ester carboxylesterase
MNSHLTRSQPEAELAPMKLVLFVHGLGGDPTGTWGRFPELLSKEEEFEKLKVGHFSYPTSLFRWPFSRRAPKVQTLAGALQTQIDNRFEKFEEITLVCHSLGGLIAKQYLVDQVELGRVLRVKRLLLYAVPNNGAGLASIAVHISWRHGQLKQLCRDSDLVRRISQGWARCKLADRVRTQYVVAALDRIVSEHSAVESWGNASVDVVADRGHIDVIKPIDANDISFLILKRFLAMGSGPKRDGIGGGPGDASSMARDATTGLDSGLQAETSFAPNSELRVSMSALLRIEDGDRYLLVRNTHRPESFGPFGGVFKFHSEARSRLDKLDFRPQAIDPEMRNDIRGFLPFRCLDDFLSWFREGTLRETYSECLRRELREECSEVGMGEVHVPDSIRFRHIRSVIEGPEPIPGHNYIQYRIFEVYDLVSETEQDRSFRTELEKHSQKSTDLLWATSSEIIGGRASGKQVIGHHTPYLLGQQRYRQDDPPFARN